MLEPEGELRAGNAILNVAFTGGAAVGPAVAGGLVAAFGVQTALLLDAASFYAIAWILFTAGPLPQAEPEPGHLRQQVRAGIDYIRGHETLRRLIAAEAAALVFFSAVVPIEVVYAKETLGAGDTGYGILLASWGVGMVFGSVLFATVRRASLPTQLFFSTLAIAVGYLGMAVAPTLAVACAASVVGGTGNGVQWVAVISAVQELTSAQMQARVLSVLESISAALPALGFVIGGLIADLQGPRATFAFAGVGVIVVVAVAAPLLGRHWPVQTARESDSDAEDAVMVELIPCNARRGCCRPDLEVSMRKLGSVSMIVGLCALAALALASCGRSSSGKEGGTLNVSFASYPDALDPQFSYTTEGWSAMYDTYIPLLTFAHGEGEAGSKVVPGLATGMPKVTDGGKTYTLTLAKGVKYSDGTPVKASDFKSSIERMFKLNSSGTPYYTVIDGAEDFQEKKAEEISGIEADDKTGKIVIHLTEPQGAFEDLLALLFAAPVPADTPDETATKTVPPATGPYEIVNVRPGRAGPTSATPSGKRTTPR